MRQWSCEKFAILTLKPWSHLRILIYQTWAISYPFFWLLTYTVGVRHPGIETFLKNTTSAIKANLNFQNQTTKTGMPGEQKTVEESATWYSIFPVENTDLVYGNWEDKIIWDSEVLNISMILFYIFDSKRNLTDNKVITDRLAF